MKVIISMLLTIFKLFVTVLWFIFKVDVILCGIGLFFPKAQHLSSVFAENINI